MNYNLEKISLFLSIFCGILIGLLISTLVFFSYGGSWNP